MPTAIKTENLSKAYQIGQIGTGTISRDLERWWTTRVRGKEDPFLKIGQTNDRTVKGDSDIVWSLRDINFEIEQGDAVGIIGRNGAGKSTLLKLLSRVTAPTTGSIKVKGRIASLLEVGTGFHPELSGRENIYLNGAILGMRKKEITRKLDEIIDFSGVERYIDTPVKRYSSGMYVRLAFAVAAHLESEILIVDEVLAVGDAEFQKKCLGKMGDISKGEGRTVLFVSHNMAAVKNLCTNTILIEHGTILMKDKTSTVIDRYIQNQNTERNYSYNFNKEVDLIKKLTIKKIIFNDDQPAYYGEIFKVSFSFENLISFENLAFGIGFNTVEGERVVTIDSDSTLTNNHKTIFARGLNSISLQIENFQLSPGLYLFDAGIRSGQGTLNTLDYVSGQTGFEILPNQNTPNHFNDGKTGGYRPIPQLIINK